MKNLRGQNGLPLTPRRMRVAWPLAIGLAGAIGFVGGLGAWSALAPLESAAVVPGTIVVESNRKAVQHLEGGIVGQLLVQEGALVAAGQVLVTLDQTATSAGLDLLRGQYVASLALSARLQAERDGAAAMILPAALAEQRDDAKIAELVAAEKRVFAARREQLESQKRILRQRNAQVEEEIKGLRDEIAAQDRQIKLIREETATVEDLVSKGHERRPRLLLLMRQMAEIEGARAQNVARIARGMQSIGEGEMRIVDLTAQIVAEAVQKLRDEQTRQFELTERMRSAEDVLSRTEIKAPSSGRVVGLKLFTVGGVVPPRETLMEVVPHDETLVVDAQMRLNDVDSVQAGQSVKLRFSGLNQRKTPVVEGLVQQVSADRMVDARSGQAFYALRIAIGDTSNLPAGVVLQPGMPVEAIVRTGSRTLVDYLAKPLLDSLHRALREE